MVKKATKQRIDAVDKALADLDAAYARLYDELERWQIHCDTLGDVAYGAAFDDALMDVTVQIEELKDSWDYEKELATGKRKLKPLAKRVQRRAVYEPL